MKRFLLCLLLAGCSSGVPAGTAPPPPPYAERLAVATEAVPQAVGEVPRPGPRPQVEAVADPDPDPPERYGPAVRFLPPTPESDARWRGEVVDDPLDHP